MPNLTKVGNSYFLLVPKEIILQYHLFERNFSPRYEEDKIIFEIDKIDVFKTKAEFISNNLKEDKKYIEKYLRFCNENLLSNDKEIIETTCLNIINWLNKFNIPYSLKERIYVLFIPKIINREYIEDIMNLIFEEKNE